MQYEKVRVGAEQFFSEDLRNIFNADLLMEVIREARVDTADNPLLAVFAGHSFKVSADLTPRIHQLCAEVQAQFEIADEIQFFIDGSAEINAGAIARLEDDQPHIVVLNSATIEAFTDDELRFIVGHELGHLVSRNSEMRRVIEFVFPPDTPMSPFLYDKIVTWEKLSELTADRFGYLAMPDLAVCRSVFFKLASGLSTDRIAFDPEAYQRSMDEVLEYFRTDAGAVATTHPVNPIRLKAIEYFAGSEAYAKLAKGEDPGEDADLTGKMDALVSILLTKGHSPMALHRKRFLASAGLVIASADGDSEEDPGLHPDEVEHILAALASSTHFPRQLFEQVLEHDDPIEVLADSTREILSVNPGERFGMFSYMIEIALADRRLAEQEVAMLYGLGEKIFGLHRKEMAQLIAQEVQKHFVPQLLG